MQVVQVGQRVTLTDARLAAAERSEAVIAKLRRCADLIESGEVPADSCVIAIGSGDLGTATWAGAQSWEHLQDLLGLIEDRIAGKRWPEPRWSGDRGDDYLTPAQRRKRMDAARARRRREHEAAFPWKCQCGERYSTQRGAVQHGRIQVAGGWTTKHEHQSTFSPPPDEVPALQVVS